MVAGSPRGERTGSGLQAGSSHAPQPLAQLPGGGVSFERSRGQPERVLALDRERASRVAPVHLVLHPDET